MTTKIHKQTKTKHPRLGSICYLTPLLYKSNYGSLRWFVYKPLRD